MNNNIPLFSIVVPVYNVEQYLEACIKSILTQTYTSFELILVDDGSTDTSPAICDLYKNEDKRVEVIHKKNGGLVSARKAGISIAKGKYAVCIDSDDWVDEDYLYEMAKIIEQFSPEIICFNHTEVIDERHIIREIPFRKGFYTKLEIRNEIYPKLIHSAQGTCFPPTIWAKVYNMHLYKTEQIEVDDKIKIGEDAACTIPCMVKANSIYITDKSFYFYRRNNISMTKNKTPFSWEGPELIDLHHRKRVDLVQYNFQEQINRRTVHALLNVVKTQFYRKEKYTDIKKDIENHLKSSTYVNVLKKNSFNRLSFMSFFYICLKHKILFPVFILSKIR